MLNKFINLVSNKLATQKKNHFGTHFLLIFLFILPVIFIAVFSIANSYKMLTNFTLARREAIVSLAGSTMQEKLDRIIDVGVSISTRVQFQKLIEEKKWDEAIKIMERVPQDFPYIDRVTIFDKQGILQVATNPTPELIGVYGEDFSYRGYYQGVSRNWEPYVAEVIKPAVPLGYNLVPVAIPIKSDTEEVLGFILLLVKLDTAVMWVKEISADSSGILYIVDQMGHLVAHPTLLPAEEVIDFSSVLSVQKVLKGERGVEIIFNPVEKEERITAYEPLSKYGWGVVFAESTKTAFADRNWEIIKLSIFYGVLILFAIFLGFLFLKILYSINSYRQKEKILLESIGDGIVAIDRFWNITLWNQGAEKITGWKKEDVLGKPLRNFLKLLRERDRIENILFIEEAIIYGRVGFLENHTILVAKDGKEISVGDSAAPIFDSAGLVVGAIIVFRDVSMEKESNSLKSDFTYASHQLNTPVTKVLWSLESILDETDSQKIKEKVNIAYQATKSIQKLNAQLSVISEIDQKVIIPKYENVKLADLAGEIINDFRDKCKECQINFNVEPISPALGLKTDFNMLKRILVEITENAMNYSKPGSNVNLKTNTQDNNIIFEISYNGISITEEEKPLIFTKFFRGNNFDTTNIVGAGLGLFIAQNYVKQLGGKIWFTSEKDKGTTFFISLPLV